MRNIYFPEEDVTPNDLLFLCFMIERVARKIHQRNKYVVNTIGKKELEHLLSVANVLHCLNPLQVESDWISDYNLVNGTFDITNIDHELAGKIPSCIDMGKVYQRLIIDTGYPDENYASGIIRVYNNELCTTLDNYNCSAFYEPSYVIARAYREGGF